MGPAALFDKVGAVLGSSLAVMFVLLLKVIAWVENPQRAGQQPNTVSLGGSSG